MSINKKTNARMWLGLALLFISNSTYGAVAFNEAGLNAVAARVQALGVEGARLEDRLGRLEAPAAPRAYADRIAAIEGTFPLPAADVAAMDEAASNVFRLQVKLDKVVESMVRMDYLVYVSKLQSKEILTPEEANMYYKSKYNQDTVRTVILGSEPTDLVRTIPGGVYANFKFGRHIDQNILSLLRNYLREGNILGALNTPEIRAFLDPIRPTIDTPPAPSDQEGFRYFYAAATADHVRDLIWSNSDAVAAAVVAGGAPVVPKYGINFTHTTVRNHVSLRELAEDYVSPNPGSRAIMRRFMVGSIYYLMYSLQVPGQPVRALADLRNSVDNYAATIPVLPVLVCAPAMLQRLTQGAHWLMRATHNIEGLNPHTQAVLDLAYTQALQDQTDLKVNSQTATTTATTAATPAESPQFFHPGGGNTAPISSTPAAAGIPAGTAGVARPDHPAFFR